MGGWLTVTLTWPTITLEVQLMLALAYVVRLPLRVLSQCCIQILFDNFHRPILLLLFVHFSDADPIQSSANGTEENNIL